MQAQQTLPNYEQERGKPMPSKNHGLVQLFLGVAFSRHEEQYTIIPELSLELGGRPLVPDLCVYPKLPIDWLHDEIKMTEPPLTVVEILSPTQGMDELIRKADAYFQAGVKSCWIVQPIFGVIAVLVPGQKAQLATAGEVKDPITGITVMVEEIFR
ncbi:MAG: Uma2 family endonuclease [bacterium]|nr:Uma2 family endonuclease [bacterium]